MVGDAPGDRAAAEKNGVYFYPILVRHEAESWADFVKQALPALTGEDYMAYGAEARRRFEANLQPSER